MRRAFGLGVLTLLLTVGFAGAALAAEAIVGTDRPDVLVGTGAGEEIRGKGGDDRISGRGGDDRLFGNLGEDRLKGGPGKDSFYGGRGDDIVDARDGEKDGTIDCGRGYDTVRTDGREPTFDCEREVFTVPAPTPPTTEPAP